ncbi:hypothetical protein EDEG_03940 [Edhazardia aedis USNM 41457]|uniref:S1 motif domain-containing protein n=1 Tax=Edhazardia aedis (strain USNM 41457) TaxID=1003232 RepID=J9DJC1_EDHAE|nr:hypothetical protein EDEG_03940 [Edhazardia aedis USNM 41457]|eukprot:EJW01477.1 hypothetical protein EDEG_03940 [Edhazardia aedis USNM 41457]
MEAEYNYRYYPNKFPQPGSLVMVKVKRITDLGAYVELLEYNNVLGMIVIGELSKKNLRRPTSCVKLNQVEAAFVLKVDEVKGYIDLSRKNITYRETEECYKNYSRAKIAHNVVVYACKNLKWSAQKFYDEFAFKKAQNYDNNCLYLYFTDIYNNKIKRCDFDNSEVQIYDVLKEAVEKKFTTVKYTAKAEIEVSCIGFQGIDAVKRAFAEPLKKISTEIMAPYKSPPQYDVYITLADKDKALDIIRQACEMIKDVIEAVNGGEFRMVKEAYIVSDKDSIGRDDADEESSDDRSSSYSSSEDIEGQIIEEY